MIEYFWIINFVFIVQLFLIINPFASFPFLLEAYKKRVKINKIIFGAVITAYIVAILVAIVGPFLFNMFGISMGGFKIAGGIILLLLGLEMIRAKEENHLKAGKTADHLISVIATPMLTGPATISFVTLKVTEIGIFAILLNITLAFLFVFLVFYMSSKMLRRINPSVVNIVSRIMGLFLTAISVEMISSGMIVIFGIA
jgi:multiple antibiotic resistance protein